MIYTSCALILAVAAMRGASAAPAPLIDSGLGSEDSTLAVSAVPWSKAHTPLPPATTPVNTRTTYMPETTLNPTYTPGSSTAVSPAASEPAGCGGSDSLEYRGPGWQCGWYNKNHMCGGANDHSKAHQGSQTGGYTPSTPSPSDTTYPGTGTGNGDGPGSEPGGPPPPTIPVKASSAAGPSYSDLPPDECANERCDT